VERRDWGWLRSPPALLAVDQKAGPGRAWTAARSVPDGAAASAAMKLACGRAGQLTAVIDCRDGVAQFCHQDTTY
jgi:hypothetical protein